MNVIEMHDGRLSQYYLYFPSFSVRITQLSGPISVSQRLHHKQRVQRGPVHNVRVLPRIRFGGPSCANVPARSQPEVEPPVPSL